MCLCTIFVSVVLCVLPHFSSNHLYPLCCWMLGMHSFAFLIANYKQLSMSICWNFYLARLKAGKAGFWCLWCLCISFVDAAWLLLNFAALLFQHAWWYGSTHVNISLLLHACRPTTVVVRSFLAKPCFFFTNGYHCFCVGGWLFFLVCWSL